MSYSSWLIVPFAFMMRKSFSIAGPAVSGKDGGNAMVTAARAASAREMRECLRRMCEVCQVS